ncbi:MAG: hypothetical protein ABJB98_11580 [Actinomycetota bacterium]
MAEMAERTELTQLHRAVEQMRGAIGDVRRRYGDIPAVRRLMGDVERMDLDAAELDGLRPPETEHVEGPTEVTPLTDDPVDPALWADADDEGLGGYLRGNRR